MMIILSPSKSMDMEPVPNIGFTQPQFISQAEELVKQLRTFSTADLMEFMSISESLAELNRKRFSDWQQPFTSATAKQALYAFTGDVYDGLDAGSLPPERIPFAQKNLRILSGLYGLLRPLDLIQPYRLEMGRPLKTAHADNLHQLWRERVTEALNQTESDLLINLASQEYFNAVDLKKLTPRVISPVFMDEKNGRYKIISFFAKKARGAMARYLIETQFTRTEELLAFHAGGYAYAPERF
ncbi:MAG: peroxide stress protein YaaA, partial [Kiritimatiellaceae bacterium]|nr:peroxide stress protein YaaA [Kiritimatiellaceae bacterium]